MSMRFRTKVFVTVVWIVGTLALFPWIYQQGADDGLPPAVALMASAFAWPVIVVLLALNEVATALLDVLP